MPTKYLTRVPLGDPDIAEALLQYSSSEQMAVFRSIKYSNLKPLSNLEAIAIVGVLVDLSEDLEKKDGLEAAVQMGLWLLETRNLSGAQKAKVHYCLGNSHYSHWKIEYNFEVIGDSERIESAIYHYRKALTEETVDTLHTFHICQMHTNLANSLSVTGRYIEAIEYWEKVISIDPSFSMAWGNLGQGLHRFGYCYTDTVYSNVIHSYAYNCLLLGAYTTIHKPASETWKELAEDIRGNFSDKPVSISLETGNSTLGSTSTEIAYRQWCLENRLFLNPLNDLGEIPVGACDPILCSIETQNPTKKVSCQGIFNQIKQEYAIQRYLLYRGLNYSDIHFSDIGVHLVDTLDYPEYGYHVELLKVFLQSFVHLFHRISFLINYYFELGLKKNKVDHDSIWEVGDWWSGKKNPLLSALYWLNKDLDESSTTYVAESLDPGLADLKVIRNWMVHRYVKIHWIIRDRSVHDELSDSITLSELEDYTLRAAKKTRAAIMYLGMAVNIHEKNRARHGITAPPWELLPYELDRKQRA